MNALLQTKKMFIENYGSVPPMIGFLGIDPDGAVYDKELVTSDGKRISLNKDEQCAISVQNPRDFYNNSKEQVDAWLPECNRGAILSLNRGAGQVRTNGRLAFLYNFARIKQAIEGVINRITSFTIVTDEKWDVLDGSSNEIEAHMIFSLSGGSGAGTFIDTAYLLKNILGNRGAIAAYAVLPNVFSSMVTGGVAMANTKPNASVALRELDYFMSLSLNNEVLFPWKWNGEPFVANTPPFSMVTFVDNKNSEGTTYDHVNQLGDMISLALVSSSGQIGNATASVMDNVVQQISGRTLDVQNKRAWGAAIGCSEIIFRNHSVADAYRWRVAIKLLDKLLGYNGHSAENAANAWIDEVQIRENGGSEHDDVIDALLAPNKLLSFDLNINELDEAGAETSVYLDNAVPKAEELRQRGEELKERVSSLLLNKIKSTLNVNGLSYTESFLAEIERQLAIYLEEMEDEIKDLNNRESGLKVNLDTAVQDAEEYMAKFFKTASGKKEREESILDAVRAYGINRSEVLRRSYAKQFFIALQSFIEAEKVKLHNLKAILATLKDLYANKVSRLENSVDTDNSPTTLDLTGRAIIDLEVSDEDIVMSDFLNKLPDESVYLINNSDLAKSVFDGYLNSLKKAKDWEHYSINTVIKSLSKEALEDTIRQAVRLATCFLDINDLGYVIDGLGVPVNNALDKFCYLAIPDEHCPITSDAIKNLCLGASANVEQISTGLDNKIIIYRMAYTFPVFCINGIKSYGVGGKIATSPEAHSIDQALFRRMEAENWDFFPHNEQEDRDLAAWVLGFALGSVKRENGSYHYRDTNNEDAVFDDYWISLNTEFRDIAFQNFRLYSKQLFEQYQRVLDTIAQEQGRPKVEELVRDVKANYLSTYANCELDNTQIKEPRNKAVADLMKKELKYVKEEL